jgi:thiol:disulfide interchange protein DsbA
MKKILSTIFIVLPILVFADVKSLVQENIDYKIVTSKINLPHHNNKLNVTEFFSYHCGHCYLLVPYLESWKNRHPEVDFNQMQVVWGNYFTNYAKINFTINTMNKTFINNIIFKAVQEDSKNLDDENTLKQVLANNLSKKDYNSFMGIYGSFATSTKPNEYKNYTEAFNIKETPLLIVDNKYLIMPASPEKLLTVLDAVVEKALKARGSISPNIKK